MRLFQWLSVALLLGLNAVVVAGCSGGGEREVEVLDPSKLPPQQALYELATRGDVGAVEALLQANPSLIDAPDEGGRTPLHYAAANNRKKMVDFLLEHGANPLATDADGYYAADAARQEGYIDLANALVQTANAAGQNAGQP